MKQPNKAMDPPTGFSQKQISALEAPLDRANVRQREQGRSRVNYLEGWHVINEANRIFGFDGWNRETMATTCVAERERTIGRDQKPGWGVTYTARVRVTVIANGMMLVVREGTGAGHGIDVDLGQAHESAIKEAETDAMKRALMTFGNAFGLALYDKEQRQVEDKPPPSSPAPLIAPHVILAQARKVLLEAGATPFGIAKLTSNLTNGLSETFADLDLPTLQEIINQPPTAEQVARLNGDTTAGQPAWISSQESDDTF